MTPRAPNRPHNPQAVGEGQQVAEEADKFGAGVYAHDDGRTDNQRGGDDAHGQAVGGTIDLLAELIEAFEIERHAHLAFLQAAAEAEQVLRQVVSSLQQGLHMDFAFTQDVLG